MTPRWVNKEALLLLHAESLAEHGGREGLRDGGLLEAALARPVTLLAYKPETGIERLAAAYALGLAKNHPFVDGNKRAALLCLGLFLTLNGKSLTSAPLETAEVIFNSAAGQISEEELTAWIMTNSKPLL